MAIVWHRYGNHIVFFPDLFSDVRCRNRNSDYLLEAPADQDRTPTIDGSPASLDAVASTIGTVPLRQPAL